MTRGGVFEVLDSYPNKGVVKNRAILYSYTSDGREEPLKRHDNIFGNRWCQIHGDQPDSSLGRLVAEFRWH